jgi:hypothetical protein
MPSKALNNQRHIASRRWHAGNWPLRPASKRFPRHSRRRVNVSIHQLRERLAVLLGATGFDALWARAMHLAQPEFRPGDTAVEKQSFLGGAYSGPARDRARADCAGDGAAAGADRAGESSAEMLAQRMGLPDGPILSAALDRLLSLKYAIKRDDTTGAIYRAVAQALG